MEVSDSDTVAKSRITMIVANKIDVNRVVRKTVDLDSLNMCLTVRSPKFERYSSFVGSYVTQMN